VACAFRATRAGLTELAREITTALAEEKIARFQELVNERGHMLQAFFGNPANAGILGEFGRECAAQNETWIIRARELLNKRKAELDRVRLERQARRTVRRAYSPGNGSDSRILSRKG